MAGGAYYGDVYGFGNDDSFLWGQPPPSSTDFNWSFGNEDEDTSGDHGDPENPNGTPAPAAPAVAPAGPANPNNPFQSNTNSVFIPQNVGTDGVYTGATSDTTGWPTITTGSGSAVPTGNETQIGGGDEILNGNDGLNMGGGWPGGSGGGGGGNSGMGVPFPVPGLGWPAAIVADVLLSNGNIFGGGGSITNLPSTIGNIVANPIGSVNSSLSNLGDSIMGPNASGSGAGQAAAAGGVIAWPGGNNGTGGPLPQTTQPPSQVETNNNTNSIFFPTGSGNATTGGDVGPSANNNVQGPPSNNNEGSNRTIAWPVPTGSGNSGSAGNAVQTQSGNDDSIFGNSGGGAVVLPAGGAGGGTTGTSTGGDNHNSNATVLPGGGTTAPGGGGPNVTVPPIVPTNHPTMPTPTLPPPRSYYNEGNQSTQDLGNLWQQISQLYGNASGAYANTDYANYNNIANQFGGSNNNLTGIANGQTAAANTSLRTGNLNDVQNLYGQALGIRNAANPDQYGPNGALTNYTSGAQGNLQYAQNQLANAGNLSPEDVRNSQQAAREAWSARGLVNSPGAVGAEILNRSDLTQQRQQQAFNNVNTALGGMQGATSAQQQNVFDPFSTILGAQYGQQTNNAGSNNSLFGQAASFGSGQQGNQFVQNAFNPYNNYSQDVYNTNFNAANAQYLGAQNNAAALQGANTQANAQLVNNFFGALSGLYGSGALGSCWVAREVYGVSDPKWLLFRHWLLTKAPSWFRRTYLKHGEKFAAWLSRNEWAKPAIRTFMDSKINQTFIFKEDFSHAV